MPWKPPHPVKGTFYSDSPVSSRRSKLTHRKQNLKKKKEAKIFKCDSAHWLKITKYHQLDRPWVSKSEILTQKIVAAKLKKQKKQTLNLKTSRTIFSRVSAVRFLSNIQALLGYNILPHRYPHLSSCFFLGDNEGMRQIPFVAKDSKITRFTILKLLYLLL